MRITLLLIVINILVFIYSLTDFENIINQYGFQPAAFLAGEYHRIFTSIFLHASLGHIFSNMLALWLLGYALEKKIESWQYFLVYFAGGILGNLIMLIPIFASPTTIGIGASGAISAIIGLGTFFSPGKFVVLPPFLPVPFVAAGTIYFLSQALNLFNPSPIAYPVHLVGMIVGAFFGLAWVEERKWRVVLFLLTLAFIIVLPDILKLILLEIGKV